MSAKVKLFESCVSTVAYAEVRAIMLGWAGVRDWNPALRARAAISRAIDTGKVATLITDARQTLRDETGTLLTAASRGAPPWPYSHTIGPGQVGNTAGLESIFHLAGMLAGECRNNDPRVLALAVNLTDYVQYRTS